MAYATWLEDPCHEVCLRADFEPLDARALLLGAGGHEVEHRGKVVWRDEALPTPEDARALLCDAKGNPSEFFKFAKAQLPKGSPFYGPIFDPSKTFAPEEGSRYTRLRSATAWASGHLTGTDGIEPIHIFALFHDQVAQWGEDGDGTLFVERLWTFCQHFWALDDARTRAEALQAQVAARDAQEIIQGMIDGVAAWHPPIASMEFNEARRWILRHLAVSISGSSLYYIMDLNGQYSPNGVTTLQLMPEMIVRNLNKIVKLKNEEGRYKDAREILVQHSTSVRALKYEGGSTHSRIEAPGTAHAALIFGVYARRTDLTPQWDDDVDEWLRRFGGPSYATLCEWIGHAVAFDEGALPMLSVVGAPDCGKKLLVQGLAECMVDACTADGEALFGDWNESLLRSPIVWTDEGWSIGNIKHPADRIREVIGAPEIRLKRRFQDTATLKANLRIIITANTFDVISRLGLGRELDESSQRALAERLIHINVPDGCSEWLKERGGMRFTGAKGRRWIAGDGRNQPSDYILARHFLKLHEMTADIRENQRGRYLMSGLRADTYSTEVMAELRTASGGSPQMVTAIFRMLNSMTGPNGKVNNQKFDRVYADEDTKNVWILPSAVVDYMKSDDYFTQRDFVSLRSASKAIENLTRDPRKENLLGSAHSSCSQGRFLLRYRNKLGAQKWRVLDIPLLLELARKWGVPVPILESYAEGAKVLKFPAGNEEQEQIQPPAPPQEASA